MKTWILWLLAVSAAGAQEIEIVAVGDSLTAPDPRGAVLVSAGGTVSRAEFAHPKLREALEEYLEVAGFQTVYVSAKDPRVKRGLIAGECRRAGSLSFVGAETLDELTRALVSAGEDAVVVLLTRHDPVDVADWMRATPKVRLAIVSGHLPYRPEALRVAEGRHLVITPPAGQAIRIRLKGATATSAFESLREPTEAVRKFLADRSIPLRGFAEPKEGGGSAPETGPLAELPPDSVVAFGGAARNRALRAVVHTIARRDRRLLLDVEWENAIPLWYVYERKKPEEVKLGALKDCVFLVVDGARVAPIESSELSEVRLESVGSKTRGTLVFAVPEFRSLEFRFYDFVHGHAAIPLVRASDAAKAVSGVERNEVVELAVYGVRVEGTRWEVDVRGRSLRTVEADVTAFDPKAKPGTKFRTGAPYAWTDRGIVFLPDLATGGTIAIDAPEGASSCELKCEFAGAKTITLVIRR